jgi:hypothetical protein
MNEKIINFFDKMQKVDRRIIYLIVALSIIIPLVIPFNSPTYTSEPTENIYRKIDSFAGDPNKAVLLSFMHDASTMPELFPMEVAVLRHCFERDVKVFTICFTPAAAPLVDYAINTAKENYDVSSGVDYLNLNESMEDYNEIMKEIEKACYREKNFSMKDGTNKGKKYRKYKRISEEEKQMIFKLYEEKMELRKIARIMGRSLSSIQYQLRKKMKEYKILYNQFINLTQIAS